MKTAFYDTAKLKNGKEIHRFYLPKTGDGIQVQHFSTISFFGAVFPNRVFSAATSIRDDNVLKDYHDQFIPKAVKYSAGLLDYFFRGTMSVILDYDAGSDTYTFTNKNTSTQDFYNGSFSLIEENASGSRTNAAQYSLSSLVSGGKLSPGSSVNMTFHGLAPSGNKFLVVYQGTIGLTGGSPSEILKAKAPEPGGVSIWSGAGRGEQ